MQRCDSERRHIMSYWGHPHIEYPANYNIDVNIIDGFEKVFAEYKQRRPQMLSEEFADRQRTWKPVTLSNLWDWEQKSKDLESENAELKKYLKHARDDKKIRLGEIEGLEAENVRLRMAAVELIEVAGLRGDNELPHPEDDPGLWTARMQTAWDEMADAVESEGK